MKRMRRATLVLLAFLGLGAFVGAIPMILWPMKTQWNLLPVSILEHSPFNSFFYPGVILLVANGVLAFWVMWRVMKQKPLYGLWTVFQGCVLLGWLVTECWMIRAVGWAHYWYAAVALALMVLGFAMAQSKTHQPAA